MKIKEILETALVKDIDDFKKAAKERKLKTGKDYLVLRRKETKEYRIVADDFYSKWPLSQHDMYIVVHQTNNPKELDVHSRWTHNDYMISRP